MTVQNLHHTKDEVPPLEFSVSETQREEEEFEDQIPDVPEDTESPPEELLEFLLTEGDQLGTKKWYKKVRSIKLLSGLSKKDHRSTQVL